MNIFESAANASWAQSMFGMGFVNLSGTCATTRIIQCYQLGIYTCEVSRKFEQDPDHVLDLHKPDFLARKKVVDAVDKWCSGKDELQLYLPILYDCLSGDVGTCTRSILDDELLPEPLRQPLANQPRSDV